MIESNQSDFLNEQPNWRFRGFLFSMLMILLFVACLYYGVINP